MSRGTGGHVLHTSDDPGHRNDHAQIIPLRIKPPLSVRLPMEHVQIRDPEHVALVRDLDCPAYDDCLGVAVEKKWDGFSCQVCPSER